jgi:hypothetical protein
MKKKTSGQIDTYDSTESNSTVDECSIGAFRGTLVGLVLIRCHSLQDLSLMTCLTQRTDGLATAKNSNVLAPLCEKEIQLKHPKTTAPIADSHQTNVAQKHSLTITRKVRTYLAQAVAANSGQR